MGSTPGHARVVGPTSRLSKGRRARVRPPGWALEAGFGDTRRMLAPVLLVLAAAPTAQSAEQLAHEAKWDALYLAFSAQKPESFGAPDKARIARALVNGCEALLDKDPVMAYSLGDRAAAFEPTAPSLLCLAQSARKTEQRGAAEKALREGLARYPRNGAFGLELGRQLLEDKDGPGAADALAKVPRGPEHAEAVRLLARARALAAQDASARAEATEIERRIYGGGPKSASPTRHEQAPDEPAVTTGLSYTSSVGADGMRTRANSRFVFKYFNGQRDFGQRAEYEGRITDAMEDAYRFSQSVLGRAREEPVDVILYTHAEFATHMGAITAQVVAGLYREGAIRINDAAELTRETRATLTHEYVHSVIDEAAHNHGERVPTWMNEGLAEYVEWRYLGSDDPPITLRVALRAQAQANTLPSLESLSQGMLVARAHPELLYAQSAVAMRLLFEQLGPEKLFELFGKLGAGANPKEAIEEALGHPLSELDEDVRSELAKD